MNVSGADLGGEIWRRQVSRCGEIRLITLRNRERGPCLFLPETQIQISSACSDILKVLKNFSGILKSKMFNSRGLKTPPCRTFCLSHRKRFVVTRRHVGHPATEAVFNACMHAFHDSNYSQRLKDGIVIDVLEGPFNAKTAMVRSLVDFACWTLETRSWRLSMLQHLRGKSFMKWRYKLLGSMYHSKKSAQAFP